MLDSHSGKKVSHGQYSDRKFPLVQKVPLGSIANTCGRISEPFTTTHEVFYCLAPALFFSHLSSLPSRALYFKDSKVLIISRNTMSHMPSGLCSCNSLFPESTPPLPIFICSKSTQDVTSSRKPSMIPSLHSSHSPFYIADKFLLVHLYNIVLKFVFYFYFSIHCEKSLRVVQGLANFFCKGVDHKYC